MQLPKLRKVNLNRPVKKKILLLSDDMMAFSGIATMSKELIRSTCHYYDWVQLGAALKHPQHGQIFDFSDDFNKECNIDHSYVKMYAHTGYGNPRILTELIQIERPDAIMIFTDPRFWGWLFALEHEIRSEWKIPILYWNIWDAPPSPEYNLSFYTSCDLILNISQQTKALVDNVLKLAQPTDSTKSVYLPHGINSKLFKPVLDDPEYHKFETEFKKRHNSDFVVFWNNRNVRRKQPGDVILAFKVLRELVLQKYGKTAADKCCLLMKTAVVDANGTDLIATKEALANECNIVFNQEGLSSQVLNYFYNLADVTLNIASNEGFGLSNAESIMAGTMVVANVTGGLQDLMNFNNSGIPMKLGGDFVSNHTGEFNGDSGPWAVPVFPSNISLQGSPQTPYIFDDRCNFSDVGLALFEVYEMTRETRKSNGLKGREWMCSSETLFDADNMGIAAIGYIDEALNNFKPKRKYQLTKV